jgi:hypothetical protein
MAKKTTRHRKEIAQQRAIQQAAANVALATSRPSAPTATPGPLPGASVPAADEYQHVRADLRRIAILAISIVAILVALSFVIR